MQWQWLLWVALFAIGVLNGLLVTGVFYTRTSTTTTTNVASVVPQTPSPTPFPSTPPPPPPSAVTDLYAGLPDDGLGQPSRGNISDWCYALRPFTDPLGPFLVPDSPQPNTLALEVSASSADAPCLRYVAAPLLPGLTLGDRVLSWATAALVSVAWQMPLATVGARPLEACGADKPEPGAVCSPGAEAALGLTRGIPRVTALLQNHRGMKVVDVTVRGTTLEEIIAETPMASGETCNVVYMLQSPLPMLRDLAAARLALSARLGVAFRRQQQLRVARTRFSTDAVAVAIHVQQHDDADWLQQLLWQLMVLCNDGNFRGAPEKWTTAKSVVFNANSYAPVHVYAFAASAEDAAWVRTMLPQDSTVVIDDSEADVLRHLATADMLLCGTSTLCRAASLHTTRSLALVPSNRESREFNPCPGDVQCIPSPVDFTQEQRLRFLDVLDRWLIRRSASCPPQWLYPY